MQALDIALFFRTVPGMYIAQAFLHSLVAMAVVDSAILAWNITSPFLRQKLRLIVILFPAFSFPLYQLVNPGRGLISFRLEALFDLNRWLTVELWGVVPLGVLFLLMLVLTSVVFFLQELVPVLMDTVRSEKSGAEQEAVSHNPAVEEALHGLSFDIPDIEIFEDDEAILFSSTGRRPTVFMSTGLIGSLNAEQLQAAVAHEVAHIKRSRRPVLVVTFLFRMVMFFNPVALLEFRRIVQEEEKICDDVAVCLTRNPRALAETLKVFRHAHAEEENAQANRSAGIRESLEHYSHDISLEIRIVRLEQGAWHTPSGEWFQLAATLGAISVLCYFIV